MRFKECVNPALFIFAPESHAARKLADPKDKDYADFKQLKKSIADQGLLNTFTTTMREDKYLILDGNRRALACQQLQAEGNPDFLAQYPDGLPVQVMEASDAEVLMLQLSGNANSKKQPAASLAKKLRSVLLMTNITIADLAKGVGLTEAYTEALLKLNMLPEDVKAAIDAGEITATNAFHLNSLPTELLTPEMIDQAKIKSGTDFCNYAQAAKKAFLAAQKSDTPAVDGEIMFSPTPKLRMKSELEAMYQTAIARAKAEPTEANKAFAEAFKWCFRMDDATLESDGTAFELAKAKKAEDKVARAKERDAKKTADILKSLEGNPELAAQVAAKFAPKVG